MGKLRLPSYRHIYPLLLAIFARALPLTMLGPLLPGIARSLGAGLAEVGWIIATYATGSLIAQPVMGRLSDVRGRKVMLLWCVALFAAGSMISALSTSLWLLVSGRMVAALGAGGIQPVVTAIVADRWPQSSRGAILGAIYGMYGVGTMAGALMGGAIVDGAIWLAAHEPLPAFLASEFASYPWHLVFWVNVVVAAVTFVTALTLPEDERAVAAKQNGFDWGGMALVAGFTVCAMAAATNGTVISILSMIGATSCLLALVIWESRAKAPLFDPALLRGRGQSMVYLIAFCFGIPSFSLTIYSATYFIAQFNATEAQSGLALFGLAAAYVVGAIGGGQAVRSFGAKLPLVAGLVLAGVALAVMSTTGGIVPVIGSMVLGGLGLGLASAPPNALLLQYVPASQAGGASGLAIMLATSGSITAPALVSAFLHYGRATSAAEIRGEFGVGAVLCALCCILAFSLPQPREQAA